MISGSDNQPSNEGTKTSHAVLVAHGIGEQRPFQVLDNFSRGLWQVLPQTEAAKVVHYKSGSGVFDHYIHLESRNLNLDIYELYWAPLAAGRATFRGIVRWIINTAFTPLRIFSYNVPLIIHRAMESTDIEHEEPQDDDIKATIRKKLLVKALTLIWPLIIASITGAFGSIAIRVLAVTLRHRFGLANWLNIILSLVVLGTLTILTLRHPSVPWFKVSFQLGRELWRIVYIALVAVAAAAGGAYVVSNGSNFLKSLWQFLANLSSPSAWKPADWLTVGFFISSMIAFMALLHSLPSQLKDYKRIHGRLKFHRGRLRQRSEPQTSGITAELRGRRLFLFLTPVFVGILTLFLSRVMTETQPCTGEWFCISNVVTQSLQHATANKGAFWHAAITAMLVFLGFLVKRVYADYIGDVALYTSADENSRFFRTRAEILREATRKTRWLLRKYDTVSLAGHSLGSVIMYDVIGRLRLEYQVSQAAVGPISDEDRQIGAIEFNRIRRLITFGSPLNKVIYLFRTTVPGDETIRAHILREIHGLRRPPELNSEDHEIEDKPDEFDVKTNFYWLNVYAPWDPVSARLDFFDDVDNQRFWYWNWGACHTRYWRDPKFYRLLLPLLSAEAVPYVDNSGSIPLNMGTARHGGVAGGAAAGAAVDNATSKK